MVLQNLGAQCRDLGHVNNPVMLFVCPCGAPSTSRTATVGIFSLAVKILRGSRRCVESTFLDATNNRHGLVHIPRPDEIGNDIHVLKKFVGMAKEIVVFWAADHCIGSFCSLPNNATALWLKRPCVGILLFHQDLGTNYVGLKVSRQGKGYSIVPILVFIRSSTSLRVASFSKRSGVWILQYLPHQQCSEGFFSKDQQLPKGHFCRCPVVNSTWTIQTIATGMAKQKLHKTLFVVDSQGGWEGRDWIQRRRWWKDDVIGFICAAGNCSDCS
mmetsp:Transcript_10298/g.30160  ORF Transcript_10298/g.30160 Transcript_10298/m.30160 type:complete len:271 (-) Transcript_10298:130-942(-)